MKCEHKNSSFIMSVVESVTYDDSGWHPTVKMVRKNMMQCDDCKQVFIVQGSD
jgi:hypothetical protein